MNIDTQSKITSVNTTNTSSSKVNKEGDAKFSDELNKVAKQEPQTDVKETNEAEKNKEVENPETQEVPQDTKETVSKAENEAKNEVAKADEDTSSEPLTKNEPKIEDVIGGLQETFEEINKLNQKNEKNDNPLKDKTFSVDEDKKEENELIDNNINIPEKPEQQLPQMNANMNFNSNGQPFSAFVENTNNDENSQLSATETDLAEESAILSTMSENMAIAQKNMLLNKTNKQEVQPAQQEKQVQPINALEQAVQVEEQADSAPKTKTVTNEQGIKKVDVKTNVTTETIVKFDEVAMNKNDVEFFANLVENGSVDMNSVQNAQKSSQVSKTLADMIAKSMQDNQPIRINFDNDISVIIKVGKNGKISADFLPSSQVAEAYLKENLPILKQRFDDNNIDYEELNHRKQEQQDDRNNRKKGRKDE